MAGRIKRIQAQQDADERAAAELAAATSMPICPLCDRPIPLDQGVAHHLVPKSKGGRETTLLHKACHQQVHATFSETELARHYNNAEALKEHPEIAKFVAWISNKPLDTLPPSRKTVRRR